MSSTSLRFLSDSLALPSVGEPITPARAMALAIQEGKRGAGSVSPNPLVGCTIVDSNHRFLSVGFHKKAGSDHAEVDALKKLGDASRIQGAHVYVTLEPCAHQGRTPSCAKTLVPLKPSSVTYAVEDPNPLVAGKGALILREAGIQSKVFASRKDVPLIEREQLTSAAEELAEVFLHFHRTQSPFVAIKVASALDGQIALASGESKWITGELAREHVHSIRAQHDGVAVGRGTYVADDPSLNVRHRSYPHHVNKAVVFDPRGKALSSIGDSNLLKCRSPESVFVVVDQSVTVSNPSGVQIVSVPVDVEGIFDLKATLNALKDRGFTSLMVEGGAQTIGAFFSQNLVQRLHVYQAPLLIGGRHGVAWSSGFGVEKMSDRIFLDRSNLAVLGPDLYWSARVRSRILTNC